METVFLGSRPLQDATPTQRWASVAAALQQWGDVLSLPSDADLLACYDRDASSFGVMRPLALFRPNDATAIAAALDWCAEERVALTPRCGGTGLSGGAQAPQGGIVMLTGHLRQILDYDAEAGLATVEPGVTPVQLNQRIGRDGWRVPCPMETGAVAGMAGIVATGARPYQQGRGPFLTDLVTGVATARERMPAAAAIGAEGTLGVITAVTVRLLPQPEASVAVVVTAKPPEEFFLEATVRSVEQYLQQGVFVVRCEGSESAVASVTQALGGENRSIPRLPVSGRKPSLTLCSQLPLPRLEEGVQAVQELASAAELGASLMVQHLDGRLVTVLSNGDPSANPQAVEAFLTAWSNVVASLGGVLVAGHGAGALYPQFLPPFQPEGQSAAMAAVQRRYDPAGLFVGNKLFPKEGRCLERRWEVRDA